MNVWPRRRRRAACQVPRLGRRLRSSTSNRLSGRHLPHQCLGRGSQLRGPGQQPLPRGCPRKRPGLMLAAGHVGVSAAHPCKPRVCGSLRTKVDGTPVGVLVEHGATKCATAKKVLRAYLRTKAPSDGSPCVREHLGWSSLTQAPEGASRRSGSPAGDHLSGRRCACRTGFGARFEPGRCLRSSPRPVRRGAAGRSSAVEV
jgi:hypothetical protein